MIAKSDYSPCQLIGDNVYKIMVGREDVFEDILAQNEEGKMVPTGEKQETDNCIVSMEIFYYKPTADSIVRLLLENFGVLDLQEVKVILEMLEDDITNHLKQVLIHNIKTYDKSGEVNGFQLNGVTQWVDIDLRVKLCSRTLPAEKASGKDKTILWMNGVAYELPIEKLEAMLQQVEVYAKKCLDVTNQNLYEAGALETVDAILAFDYKGAYPEQLIFNL